MWISKDVKSCTVKSSSPWISDSWASREIPSDPTKNLRFCTFVIFLVFSLVSQTTQFTDFCVFCSQIVGSIYSYNSFFNDRWISMKILDPKNGSHNLSWISDFIFVYRIFELELKENYKHNTIKAPNVMTNTLV